MSTQKDHNLIYLKGGNEMAINTTGSSPRIEPTDTSLDTELQTLESFN